MNDERDERLELASAYLDGEVGADERARVEADPELLALVAELRAARDAVASTETPPPHARDAAVAAALAAFDELGEPNKTEHDDTPGGATPPPTPLPPRRWRWSHGLGAAAAALLIVVAGLAIFRDDADAPTADQAAREVPVTTDDDTDAADDAEPASETSAPADDVPADAAITDSEFALEPPAAAPAPTERRAAEHAEDAQVAANAETAQATAAPLPRLTSAEEVADFAATLDPPPPSATDAETDCEAAAEDERAVEPNAIWVDDDGSEHDVVIVLVDDDAAALDLATCSVLAASQRQSAGG